MKGESDERKEAHIHTVTHSLFCAAAAGDAAAARVKYAGKRVTEKGVQLGWKRLLLSPIRSPFGFLSWQVTAAAPSGNLHEFETKPMVTNRSFCFGDPS